MTRDRWTLGNAGNVSPVIFFKAYKKIKKIRPRHVGCSLPVLMGLFSGDLGTLNLPNMRDLAFFASFFLPITIVFFCLVFSPQISSLNIWLIIN
jgi:hypothetical protein